MVSLQAQTVKKLLDREASRSRKEEEKVIPTCNEQGQKHITPKCITLSQSSGFLGNQSKFTS